MADVFISYSRRDAEFVQRLNNAFVNSGRVVWIDWQSIPRGEDWWQEIQQGIESAESFICVVTENWLTSEICQKEIEYARQQNKRILPVIRQQIEDEIETRVKSTWIDLPWAALAHEQWTHLRHLNWILFDDDVRFETEFSILLKALDEDQPHIKAHTRYQVRALEWERSNHNPSFLLSGDDLKFAESWLREADSEHKTPEPTTVQRGYITESRRSEDARQAADTLQDRRIKQFRWTALALGVFFALALIASAVLAKNVAETSNQAATSQAQVMIAGQTLTPVAAALAAGNTQVATARTQVAIIGQTLTPIPPILTKVANQIDDSTRLVESQRLAALSRDQAWGDLSALLAIRGLRTHYSLQADAALQNALLHYSRPFYTDTCLVNSTAISPDGTLMAVAGGSADVQIFDFATGQLNGTLIGLSEGIAQIKFSADSRQLVTAHADGTAKLWDVASKRVLRTFRGHQGIVYAIGISPDGKLLVTGGGDMTVRVWDTVTGKEIRQLPMTGMIDDYQDTVNNQIAPLNVAFAADGLTIYASLGLANQRHYRLNCASGGSGSGGGSSGTITHEFVRLWEAATGEIVRRFTAPVEASDPALSVMGSDLAVNGRTLVAVNGDGKIRAWRLNKDDTNVVNSASIDVGNHPKARAGVISPDGQTLLTTDWQGEMRFYNLPYGGEFKRIEAIRESLGVAGIFSPDGSKVLASGSSTEGSLRLISVDGVYPSPPIKFVSQVTRMEYVSDVDQILSIDEFKVGLWDWATAKQVRTFSIDRQLAGSSWISDEKVSADGKMLAVSYAGTNTVGVWDIRSGKLRHQLEHPYGNVYMLDISPDNRYLATLAGTGPVLIWELASGDLLQKIATDSPLTGMKFAPDSRGVWVGESSGGLHLFSLETGQEQRKLQGKASKTSLSLGLSPDGKFAVDMYGMVYSLTTETQMPLASVERGLSTIIFSPDGRLVAAIDGASSNAIHIWDVQTRALVRTIELGRIWDMAFSPDGKDLFIDYSEIIQGQPEGGRIIRLPVDYRDLMAFACSVLTRDIPDEQRPMFQIGDEATCTR